MPGKQRGYDCITASESERTIMQDESEQSGVFRGLNSTTEEEVPPSIQNFSTKSQQTVASMQRNQQRNFLNAGVKNSTPYGSVELSARLNRNRQMNLSRTSLFSYQPLASPLSRSASEPPYMKNGSSAGGSFAGSSNDVSQTDGVFHFKANMSNCSESSWASGRLSGFQGNLRSKRFCSGNSTGSTSSLVSSSKSLASGGRSPFYAGKTMYGGASAYTVRRNRTHYNKTIRTPVQISPARKAPVVQPADTATLSSTARRILEIANTRTEAFGDIQAIGNHILEEQQRNFDRRILLSSSRIANSSRSGSRNSGINRPPVAELHTPSLSELMKVQRLQNSTESIRRLLDRSAGAPADGTIIAAGLKRKAPADADTTPVTVPTATRETSDTDSLQFGAAKKGKFTFRAPVELHGSSKSTEQETSSVSKGFNFGLSEPLGKVWGNKPSTEPFGKQFRMADSDKWECTTCMIRNPVDKAECLACGNAKSGKTNGPAVSSFSLPPLPFKSGTSFGAQFTLAGSEKWECSACMVRNPIDKSKCEACGNTKEGNQSAPTKASGFTFGMPSVNTTTATKDSSSEPAKSQDSFGNQFRLAGKQQWECTSCMVRNPIDKADCVACGTAKESNKSTGSSFTGFSLAKPSDQVKKFSFGNISSTPLQNVGAASAGKFSFGMPTATPKSPSEGQDKSPLTKVTSPNFSFGTKEPFGKQFTMSGGDKWECASCMVRNPMDKSDCMACGAKKEGKTSPVSTIAKPTFSFGLPAGTKLGIEFGKDVESKEATKAASPMFTFGLPAGTKLVTSTGPTTDGEKKATTAAFSFGAPATAAKESEQQKDSSKPAATFTFGMSNKSPKQQDQFGKQFTLTGSDKWECGSCMVRNPSDKSACMACGTPKDSNSKKVPTTTAVGGMFSFGTLPSTAAKSPNKAAATFSFGLPAVSSFSGASSPPSQSTTFGKQFTLTGNDKWECNACMVRNAMDKSACVACGKAKVGEKKESPVPAVKAPATFSFGIPSSNALSSVTSTSPVKEPAGEKTGLPKPSSTFSFGLPKGGTQTTAIGGESKSSFSFGLMPGAPVFGSFKPTEATDPGGLFTFKSPTPSATTAAPAVQFNFGSKLSNDTSKDSEKFTFAAAEPLEREASDQMPSEEEIAVEAKRFKFCKPAVICEDIQTNGGATSAESQPGETEKKQQAFSFAKPLNQFELILSEPLPVLSMMTPKTDAAKPTDSGFGTQFRLTGGDKWECDACMVRNEPSAGNCAACQTPKPAATTVAATTATTATPMFTFKMPATPQTSLPLTTATTTTKDAGFKALVAQQANRWECPDCMTRNDTDSSQCACCSKARP